MKSVQILSSTDAFIRGLLSKHTSAGLILGYKCGDTCYILNVLKFKCSDELAKIILESISYIIQGFTILGFFVVSPDDSKDALRKLSISIPVEVFPRPMLVLHFHTKTSKLSVKEVYIENREERNRPIDYKEVREIPSDYNFIASKVTIRGLYPTETLKNKSGLVSRNSKQLSKYFPAPSTVIFNSISYNEKKLISGNTKNLTNLLIQAAQARLPSEPNDESMVFALPITLVYDHKGILSVPPPLLPSSYPVLHDVSGIIRILGAVFSTDTTEQVIQTLQSSMLQTISLSLLDLEIDNSTLTDSILTRPSEIAVVYVTSNTGIPIPFILPSINHPKYQHCKERIENIFDLAAPLIPQKVMDLEEEVDSDANHDSIKQPKDAFNVTVKSMHTSYVPRDVTNENITNNDNSSKLSSRQSVSNTQNRNTSSASTGMESSSSSSKAAMKSDEQELDDEEDQDEEEEGEEDPISSSSSSSSTNTVHQLNNISKKNPPTTSRASKDRLLIVLIIVGVLLIVFAVSLKFLTASSSDSSSS